MSRSTLTLSASLSVLALAAVAGCRDTTSSRDTAARDALQRDLDLAQASAVSLAERDLPPTRFVSALEQGERPSASTGAAARPAKKAPTKAPRRPTRQAPPAVTAVATTEPAPAAAATEMTPAPTSSSVASTETAATPTEQPTVSGPSDAGTVGSVPSDSRGNTDGASGEGRRGRGMGGIFGGIIGVVIRGGGVGDGDHCERDQPRGGHVPTGYPGGIGGIGGVYGVPARLPSPTLPGRAGRPRM